jgi:hypothetical protein
MKYGGINILIHVFLTSALVGGEWWTSCPGVFTPGGKGPRYPLDRSLDEPQSRSGRAEKKKNIAPTGTPTSTPRPSSP